MMWKQVRRALYGTAAIIAFLGFLQLCSVNGAGSDAEIATLKDAKNTLDMSIKYGMPPVLVKAIRNTSKVFWMQARRAAPSLRNSDDLAQLMIQIVLVESSGNPLAINLDGEAYGLTQLQLPTARQYIPEVTILELLEPDTNIWIAMQHMVYLLQVFHGDIYMAVLAWNVGPTGAKRIEKSGAKIPRVRYVQKVMRANRRG